MDSDEGKRADAIGREQSDTDPKAKQRSNSTALVVLGLVLFFAGGALASSNPDSGTGGLLFGVLGVGLVVAGIVIRPRT